MLLKLMLDFIGTVIKIHLKMKIKVHLEAIDLFMTLVSIEVVLLIKLLLRLEKPLKG